MIAYCKKSDELCSPTFTNSTEKVSKYLNFVHDLKVVITNLTVLSNTVAREELCNAAIFSWAQRYKAAYVTHRNAQPLGDGQCSQISLACGLLEAGVLPHTMDP